jgi:hypothetical protein
MNRRELNMLTADERFWRREHVAGFTLAEARLCARAGIRRLLGGGLYVVDAVVAGGGDGY